MRQFKCLQQTVNPESRNQELKFSNLQDCSYVFVCIHNLNNVDRESYRITYNTSLANHWNYWSIQASQLWTSRGQSLQSQCAPCRSFWGKPTFDSIHNTSSHISRRKPNTWILDICLTPYRWGQSPSNSKSRTNKLLWICSNAMLYWAVWSTGLETHYSWYPKCIPKCVADLMNWSTAPKGFQNF